MSEQVYIVINTRPKMKMMHTEKGTFMYDEKPIKATYGDWDSALKFILDNNKDGDWNVVVDDIRERTVNKMDSRSWFRGICKQCGYNVIVTQPDLARHPDTDLRWYCSNKKCYNHEDGEHTLDVETPTWVKLERII